MGSPSTNGDKITVADPDSEVLIDHTRPAPGVTDVGNGRPRGDAIDHRCWPRAVGDVAAAQPGQMPPVGAFGDVGQHAEPRNRQPRRLS
ncbi:hypothetical protein [Mycobacterium sp. 23]|uniref:hypothetical protein n=1 Tax=Mycobacterium sp. 23 TaxID=3400424 RepID=UPI003AAF0801